VTRVSIRCMALIVKVSVVGIRPAIQEAGAHRKEDASVSWAAMPSACCAKNALQATFPQTVQARHARTTAPAALTDGAAEIRPANAMMAGRDPRVNPAPLGALAIIARARARTIHAIMECAVQMDANASPVLVESRVQLARRFLVSTAVVRRAARRTHVTVWGAAHPRARVTASLLSIVAASETSWQHRFRSLVP